MRESAGVSPVSFFAFPRKLVFLDLSPVADGDKKQARSLGAHDVCGRSDAGGDKKEKRRLLRKSKFRGMVINLRKPAAKESV